MPNELPQATLGRTGIEVTRLGFGGMALRDESNKWPIEDDHAEAVLNTVLDSGINFIDTADCYGRSEPFIGRFLSHRRDEYTLATKCGCIPKGREWTRENLFIGLERSLKRLQTDYIDIMQLHGATPEHVDEGRLIDALEEMRSQGKVRWIGASTSSPHLNVFTERGVFDTFQIPYSGLSRTNEAWITQAAKAGMGTVIRGGVHQGEPGLSSRGLPDSWNLWEQAKLDELRDGDTKTAFMLRLTLSHPAISTIIVGSQNVEHLRQNAEAARRGPLSSEVYEEAKRRLAAAGAVPE
jgi:aryl-alcohol dehydrogenase-like predicted oxidoreductase